MREEGREERNPLLVEGPPRSSHGNGIRMQLLGGGGGKETLVKNKGRKSKKEKKLQTIMEVQHH